MTGNAIKKCPRCRIGTLKKRNGKFGEFWGCSEYPGCRYTTNFDFLDDKSFEEKVADFMNEEHVVHKENWEPWVNASSIGEAEFCPQSFYLRNSGQQPNNQAKAQMRRGDLKHAMASQDRRCYVATYAFGSEHPITVGLRSWRDAFLLRHWYGRCFVRFYYLLSPYIIKFFGNSHLFNQLARRAIRIFAKWVGVRS